MIHVIAIVTAKPGKRDEVLDIFNANVPAVLAEDGCLEYEATVDVKDADPAFGADIFVVVEKWQDRAALKAHSVASHMAAYGKKVATLVEKVAVHVLDPVKAASASTRDAI